VAPGRRIRPPGAGAFSSLAVARQALEVLMQGTRADCCRWLRMGAGAAQYRRVAQTG